MKRFHGFLFLVMIAAVFPQPVHSQSAKLEALQAAVQANPKNADAHFNLALEYLNQQNYDAAAASFEKAFKLNSKDRQAKELYAMAKGISAFFKKDYASAVRYFQETLKQNPKNYNAAMLLGNVYLEKGETKKAEEAFKSFAAAFPDNTDAQKVAHLNLAKIMIAEKRYPEAVDALQRVLSVDSGNMDAWRDLGVAYYQMKDYAKAAEAWGKAARGASDPQVLKFLGYSYYRLGRFQDAIEQYKKSLKGNPSDAETYYNLAVAYFDNALYLEAAEAFEKAFQLNPKDSSAALGKAQAMDAAVNHYMEEGSSAYLNGDYQKAIAAWKKVLAVQPDHAEAKAFLADAQKKTDALAEEWYQNGLSAQRRGETASALRWWNKVLEIAPDHAGAKKAIANLKAKRAVRAASLVQEGDELLEVLDFEGAIEKYEQAIAAGDSKAKTKLSAAKARQEKEYQRYFETARKAEKAGDLRQAVQAYETARRIRSTAEVRQALFQARSNLRARVAALIEEGRNLEKTGKGDAARAKWEAALKLDPENKEVAELLKKAAGKPKTTVADAEAVKKLYYKGVEKYIAGEIHDAIQLWKQCLDMDPNYTNAKLNIEKAYAKLNSLKKLERN